MTEASGFERMWQCKLASALESLAGKELCDQILDGSEELAYGGGREKVIT